MALTPHDAKSYLRRPSRQITQEYTIEELAVIPVKVRNTAINRGPSSPNNPSKIVTTPVLTKSAPPTRCVRCHTASLPSVQGVRIPMKWFEPNFGIKLPSNT